MIIGVEKNKENKNQDLNELEKLLEKYPGATNWSINYIFAMRLLFIGDICNSKKLLRTLASS